MGTAAGTGFMSSLSRAPGSVPSHVYRPTYQMSGGLSSTPQARMFTPQMPTYTRPQMAPPPPSGGFGGFPMQALSPQPAYRIPMAPVQRPAADPNLAIINQAFAPGPKYVLDSDGNRHSPPPRYMEQSQRDAIMKNPGAYLEYARFVQGGGDPAQFQRSAQPVHMMTAAQQQQFNKSQAAELGKILPQAAPTSSDG